MIEINENENKEETGATKPTTEHFAMEILKQEQGKHKSKDWIIGILAATSAIIAVGMGIINYCNDCDWRKLFSSYEFVTQDGGGQNYYNSDVGGNVENGTKNNEEEEQGSR